MRLENQLMTNFLKQNGVSLHSVKFIGKGSLKGTWRIYTQDWKKTNTIRIDEEDIKALTKLGFKDFDGQELGQFSSNFLRHAYLTNKFIKEKQQ